MITVSDRQTFALTNPFFSYVFAVTAEGLLEHIYFGSPVQTPDTLPRYIRTERGTGVDFEGHYNLNLNEMMQEFPVWGNGDFRSPVFHGTASDGHSTFSFRYASHRIVKEKPNLVGLPSARGGECETLIVTLEDDVAQITAELSYTIYFHHGALARSVCFKNTGPKVFHLEHVHSSALELVPGEYDLLHLHGAWAAEFNAERLPLGKMRQTITSNRGTSSAAHNPFLTILERGANESTGKVYSTALVYSGNFSMSAEIGEFGQIRCLAGINPFNFNWRLNPGETFQSPEALHVFSPDGLRRMSHIWHDFIREKITPQRFQNVPRPTYLNTWEAAYFDMDETKLLTLADKAKEIDAEMLVLDDGWFLGRNDPKSSLGDWTADPKRFPSGIPALAKKVRAKGLKFGLWFEPEMISPNSQLFQEHPDWALQVNNRRPSLGRHQLTLDLTRQPVRDYIFEALDSQLSCGDINYVKWDMNRHMTDIGSSAWPPDQQKEVSHRYILGLYKLMRRVLDKYPNILFEMCAAGGNRFDLGMLSFMPQGWISDMCDPSGRLPIITNASYLFPLDVMTAYMGPTPNHQNGKMSSINARAIAGVFCVAQGISLNTADIEKDKDEISAWLEFVKSSRTNLMGGEFNRLIHTAEQTAWQYISQDRTHVYLAYFPTNSFQADQNIQLVNLDENARYKFADDIYTSERLERDGFPIGKSNTNEPSLFKLSKLL